jgi:hypothetical protein
VGLLWLLLPLALLDVLLLGAWIGTSSAENCSQGGGLDCSELLDVVAAPGFFLVLIAFVVVAVAGTAEAVRVRRSRGAPEPDRYECRLCGRRSKSEDDAMEHAEHAHGAMSYPDMEATWRRL